MNSWCNCHEQNTLKADRKNQFINPYHVLQVRRDATPTELRDSYRRLALWHHPGRKGANARSPIMRRQTFQMFTILAACYETLHDKDYRQQYHVLAYQMERNFMLCGKVLVGGKPIVPHFNDKDYFSTLELPSLVAVSKNITESSSSDDDDNENENHMHCPVAEETTNIRLNCNGPLELLSKARHYEPFTSPFVVFDHVFQSHIFDAVIIPLEDHVIDGPKRTKPSTTLIGPKSITKLINGTVISRHCRQLYDTNVIHTETLTAQGQRTIQVHSEPFVEEPISSVCCYQNYGSLLLCCGGKMKSY